MPHSPHSSDPALFDTFEEEGKHVILADINQNPNLGLYVYATDSFALIGKRLPEHFVRELKEVLKVPFHEMTIAGTDLLGIFLAGNSHCLLVPEIAYPHELRQLDHLNIKYAVLKSDLTCLGNNILCNDHFAYASPDFSEREMKEIAAHLKVEAQKKKLSSIPTPGALAVLNSKGLLVSNHVSDEEAAELESHFKLKVTGGTINRGNPFIKSGVICNSFGIAIGKQSGSPEVLNADEALGFVE